MALNLKQKDVESLLFILSVTRDIINDTNEPLGMMDALAEVNLKSATDYQMYDYANHWLQVIFEGYESLNHWVSFNTNIDVSNEGALKNIRVALLSWMIASLHSEFPEYI